MRRSHNKWTQTEMRRVYGRYGAAGCDGQVKLWRARVVILLMWLRSDEKIYQPECWLDHAENL